MAVILALLIVACRPVGNETTEVPSDAGTGCPGLAGETVRWIVPYSPGGGYDVYSRLLEPFYEEAIGVEIVVENRTGAAGRVGTRTVRDADPDGRTLGIVNGAALLIQDLLGQDSDIHPLEDFTAIGRIAVAAPVLFTAGDSPYQTLQQLQTGAADGPLVIGIDGIGGLSWIWVIVASELLGLEVTYVGGYPGNREIALGLIRGDVDAGGFTFESMRDWIETGDLRPVAQLSAHPAEDFPSLRDTPVVAGVDGLAAQRARDLGQDPGPAVARAAALDRIFLAGRLIVAPPGMDPVLTECLRDRLAEVARDSAFVARASRARRSIAFADASTLASELEATAAEREALGPVFRRHVDVARSGPAGR